MNLIFMEFSWNMIQNDTINFDFFQWLLYYWISFYTSKKKKIYLIQANSLLNRTKVSTKDLFLVYCKVHSIAHILFGNLKMVEVVPSKHTWVHLESVWSKH